MTQQAHFFWNTQTNTKYSNENKKEEFFFLEINIQNIKVFSIYWQNILYFSQTYMPKDSVKLVPYSEIFDGKS